MRTARSDRDPGPDLRELPMACTLDSTDGARRLARWRDLLAMSSTSITRETERIVVWVADAPDVTAELDELAAAERVCCSFADWEVAHLQEGHELRIQASADGLDAIAAMFSRD